MTVLLSQSKNHFSAMVLTDKLKKLAEKGNVQTNAHTPPAIRATETSSQRIKNINGMKFVFIKGGTFQMGDVFGEGENDEKPVHTVTLSDFYMGVYEVTFDQYDPFCDAIGRKKPDDAGWGRGSQLVINVSWHDAKVFCDWKSRKTGQKIRLPTEAEWEYAARERGRKVRFGNGRNVADPKEMNFNGSSEYKESYSVTGLYRKKTTPAGSFTPNALGLYDMSGNVWERCTDWYGEDYYGVSPGRNPKGWSSGSWRVLRGGSWDIEPQYLRCANRGNVNPDLRWRFYGFRCVRTL